MNENPKKFRIKLTHFLSGIQEEVESFVEKNFNSGDIFFTAEQILANANIFGRPEVWEQLNQNHHNSREFNVLSLALCPTLPIKTRKEILGRIQEEDFADNLKYLPHVLSDPPSTKSGGLFIKNNNGRLGKILNMTTVELDPVKELIKLMLKRFSDKRILSKLNQIVEEIRNQGYPMTGIKEQIIKKFPEIGLTDHDPFIREVAKDPTISKKEILKKVYDKFFTFIKGKHPKWKLIERKYDIKIADGILYDRRVLANPFYFEASVLPAQSKFTIRLNVNKKLKDESLLKTAPVCPEFNYGVNRASIIDKNKFRLSFFLSPLKGEEVIDWIISNWDQLYCK